MAEHKLSIDIIYPFDCFSLIRNNEEVGLMCISDRGKEIAEISLSIFKNYRYKVLSKNIFLKIINFPFNLGYKKVIAYTKIKSFARLLERFSFYGVKLLENGLEEDSDKEKIWFSKTKGEK